jgi:hypothetical protein
MLHPWKGICRSGGRKRKSRKNGKKDGNNGQESETPVKRHKIASFDKDAVLTTDQSYRTEDGSFSVKLLIFIFSPCGRKKGEKICENQKFWMKTRNNDTIMPRKIEIVALFFREDLKEQKNDGCERISFTRRTETSR